MKNFKKRFFVAILMVAFSVSFAVAQTSTVKHTVDRGETLQSIAKRYATTEAKIIELNPDAAQFVYVGMELTVPTMKAHDAAKEDNYKTMNNNIVTQTTSDHFIENSTLNNAASKNDHRKFEKELYVGVSMNNFTGTDIKDSKMEVGFSAGFTVRCYFENVFFEGSLGIATKGYKLDSKSSSGGYWDDEGPNYDSSISTKYTSYNLDLPVLVGYKIVMNDNFNIKLKVGPYFTYALSGKLREKGYMTEYDDIHSSETEHINEETKISDMKGFKNFGYGIQAGISADYKKFILSASYQRAFSKIFDKTKSYEQNILISLGYRF